jgi:hypothetical protein
MGRPSVVKRQDRINIRESYVTGKLPAFGDDSRRALAWPCQSLLGRMGPRILQEQLTVP